jgi:predicted unusual protein kinase regulating ubiquinone biosynthesis (AarF/ABC1/UbiB family)
MEGKRERVHRATAREIQESILQLKGLFIKVGQMISIMTHFLPKPITEELEGLQDSVPPAPYEAIELRFLEEFQKKPTEVFHRFEKTPIASASLGQVHLAHSKDGQKFAVKVQYPDIEEIVRIDLKTLRRIFALTALLFPQYGLKKIYQELREVILEELDFQTEGKNLELLEKNLSAESDLIFPKIFWEYSTSRILTLQFMEGVKISNLKALEELGVNPTDVAVRIINAYCRQIFIDGIYHADPHPGNFLVQPGPKIIMMDFGAVARISEPMRLGIARFIEGIIKRDNHLISQAMKQMGFIAKTENEEVFDKIVEFFYERLKDIKIDQIKSFKLDQFQRLEDLIEFRKLDISLKDLLGTFNVPKDWALLERALLLLVGLTTHLDAKLNPLTIIIPYAETFVLGKDRTFADLILEAVKEVALSYLRLPAELERTLRKLNGGEIEIANKFGQKQSEGIRAALHRLSYSLLALGGFGLGYLLQKEAFPHYEWFFYGSGFFAVLLGINLIRRK